MAEPRHSRRGFLRQETTVESAVRQLNERKMWIADGNPCAAGYRMLDCSGFLGR
jgi:hypothetical protein